MNKSLKKHFLENAQFLKQYTHIHDKEFLKKYPSPYPKFIIPWIEELKNMKLAELAHFESYPNSELVKSPSFKEYLKKIKELSTIAKIHEKEVKIDSKFLRKMNPKKTHEVKMINEIFQRDQRTDTIIDIGSGAGFLSTTLVKKVHSKSLCIDIDKKLQTAGQRRIEKWYPELKKKIQFIHHDFNSSKKLASEFNPQKSTIIGLHSCGSLSNSLIHFALKNNIKHLINFGCCYHRLKSNYNLSIFAKENGIKLTENALHLAEVSSAVISSKEMQKKINFKSYRYTLHYYLKDHFNLDFYPIGRTSKLDYQKPFYLYAKKYSPNSILEFVENKKLTQFFNHKNVQEKVKSNIAADIIRLQLGRLIELYIILDRALYLEEHGKDVKITEVFNRAISPRNIMISY